MHKKEIIKLQENRIHELEEILCPCGQHNWMHLDYEELDVILEEFRERKICARCKKIKVV